MAIVLLIAAALFLQSHVRALINSIRFTTEQSRKRVDDSLQRMRERVPNGEKIFSHMMGAYVAALIVFMGASVLYLGKLDITISAVIFTVHHISALKDDLNYVNGKPHNKDNKVRDIVFYSYGVLVISQIAAYIIVTAGFIKLPF